MKPNEKWKEDFLKEIKDKYRITGVPFYNNEDENKFKESLYEALGN